MIILVALKTALVCKLCVVLQAAKVRLNGDLLVVLCPWQWLASLSVFCCEVHCMLHGSASGKSRPSSTDLGGETLLLLHALANGWQACHIIANVVIMVIAVSRT